MGPMEEKPVQQSSTDKVKEPVYPNQDSESDGTCNFDHPDYLSRIREFNKINSSEK